MGKKYHTTLTAKEKKALKLKGINIEKVKKEFLQQLYTKEEDNYTQIDNNNNQYEYKYQEYLNYTFNSRSVAMIVSFMNKTKLFPENLKKTQKFLIHLIQIIKKLMMNEIEITLFTLNIDSYDWKNNNLNHELCLFFLGLYTKQITNKDCSLLFSKFRNENKTFLDNYQKWEKNLKKERFRIDKVNERFREINKPYNTYCKNNFIDYNGVVDIIYQLSQPYGKENKGGKIKVRKEIDNEHNNVDNNNIDNNVNVNNEIKKESIKHIFENEQNKLKKNNVNINEPNLFQKPSFYFAKRESSFGPSYIFRNSMNRQSFNNLNLFKGNSQLSNFEESSLNNE